MRASVFYRRKEERWKLMVKERGYWSPLILFSSCSHCFDQMEMFWPNGDAAAGKTVIFYQGYFTRGGGRRTAKMISTQILESMIPSLFYHTMKSLGSSRMEVFKSNCLGKWVPKCLKMEEKMRFKMGFWSLTTPKTNCGGGRGKSLRLWDDRWLAQMWYSWYLVES